MQDQSKEQEKRFKCHDFEKEWPTYVTQGYMLVDGYWVLDNR